MGEQEIEARFLEYDVAPGWDKLSGGFNNKVYRAKWRDESVIIKYYQGGGLSVEETFLDYANSVAEGFVPKILERIPELECLVLEDIRGSGYNRGCEVDSTDIDRAIEFMRRLNSPENIGAAKGLGLAKEGFRLVSEHMKCVEDRLERLTAVNLETEVKDDVHLLLEEVRVRYQSVKRYALDQLRTGRIDDLRHESLTCVSPGDFGFHNAIKTDAGAVFIDFEFSGLDEWTKCIADFEMQPRIRIPHSDKRLLEVVPNKALMSSYERTKTLRRVIWIKWLCIIMGFADPARHEKLSGLITKEEVNREIKERMVTAEKILRGEIEMPSI